MILCIEEIWNLNSIGYNLWLYAVGRICICVWYSQDYVLQLLRCFSMGWFEVWLVQYFYQNHPCCSRLCDPRGDQIGSPKLHGRHQRPEESAVFCWKHGWQWWKLMASGRVLENSHPTKILQHFGGIKCSPETKSSTKQHVLGVLSLGFLSNNCHELVKFWGQHLPTNLKLELRTGLGEMPDFWRPGLLLLLQATCGSGVNCQIVIRIGGEFVNFCELSMIHQPQMIKIEGINSRIF